MRQAGLILTDFASFRNVGRRDRKKRWYAEFRRVWDDHGVNAAQSFLRGSPTLFKELLELSTNWYPGKTGQPFSRNELYALRQPGLPNVCSCGSYTAFNSGTRTWASHCCYKCSNSNTNDKRRATCQDRYGADNPSRVAKFKRKRTKTTLERLGVENPFQSENVKQQIRLTNMERYGSEAATRSPEVQAKRRATSIDRYGHDHWTKSPAMKAKVNAFTDDSIRKARRTCKRRYGVENPMSIPAVREGAKRTSLKRYGVENAGGLACRRYKRKAYVDRFGVEHTVMGYEHLALKYFDKMKGVTSIVTGALEVPRYRFKFEGRMRNYYPDLLIVKGKKRIVVEVKSDYTMNLDVTLNVRKFLAATKRARSRGAEFWLLCYVGNKKRLVIAKNPSCLGDLEAAGIPVSCRPQ